jgi:hypothetical protein
MAAQTDRPARYWVVLSTPCFDPVSGDSRRWADLAGSGTGRWQGLVEQQAKDRSRLPQAAGHGEVGRGVLG